MSKCYWCHKKTNLYAFRLCPTCYRWFHRHKKRVLENCLICQQTLFRKGIRICPSCRKTIKKSAVSYKRIEKIKQKLAALDSLLENLTKETATQSFSPLFKPSQRSFLDILLERYYNQIPLEVLGKKYNVTREYARQCEEKAMKIIEDSILASG